MPYKSKPGARKYGENPLPQKSSGFKMKGSPMKRNFGIGVESPMKQDNTTPSYTGVNINPMSSYDYKASPDIPSFRDIVSLEQQQAYADKVDAKRAEKKKTKEAVEKYGGEQYNPEEEEMELMEDFNAEYNAEYGGDEDPAETQMEKDLKHKGRDDHSVVEVKQPKEVKSGNEINIGSNTNSYGI